MIIIIIMLFQLQNPRNDDDNGDEKDEDDAADADDDDDYHYGGKKEADRRVNDGRLDCTIISNWWDHCNDMITIFVNMVVSAHAQTDSVIFFTVPIEDCWRVLCMWPAFLCFVTLF